MSNISTFSDLEIDESEIISLFNKIEEFYIYLNQSVKNKVNGSLCDIFFYKNNVNFKDSDFILNNLKQSNFKKYDDFSSKYKSLDKNGNVVILNNKNYNNIFPDIPNPTIINKIYKYIYNESNIQKNLNDILFNSQLY